MNSESWLFTCVSRPGAAPRFSGRPAAAREQKSGRPDWRGPARPKIFVCLDGPDRAASQRSARPMGRWAGPHVPCHSDHTWRRSGACDAIQSTKGSYCLDKAQHTGAWGGLTPGGAVGPPPIQSSINLRSFEPEGFHLFSVFGALFFRNCELSLTQFGI